MSEENKRLYGNLVKSAVASQAAFLKNALPAEKAGAKIAMIATAARPRTRYTPGSDAAAVIPLARLLPARVMDAVLSRSRRNTRS